MLLHFLLAYNAKHNTLPSILVFFMLCIGLISGRTFLLLSVVSILVYFKWRYVPSLIAFAILVLLLAYFLPENPYVAHALEPVINLFTRCRICQFVNGYIDEKPPVHANA